MQIVLDWWQIALLGICIAFGIYFSALGARNASKIAPRLLAIGSMMEKADCDVADSAAQYALILKMTQDEFKQERDRGRIINRAGREVSEIAGALQSPFDLKFWR